MRFRCVLPTLVVGLLLVSAPALAVDVACCTAAGDCVNKPADRCIKYGGIPQEGRRCEDTPPPECVQPGLECRMTGGGVDEFDLWDGSMAKGKKNRDDGTDRYTFGGQAGAPTAEQPQPYGEWTHHQQRGPSGSFVFHVGTASAPEDTEIDAISCSDPGWCVQARPAPAKQLDFEGVGSFKNIKGSNPCAAVAGNNGTRHFVMVHVEDLGEPGRGGKVSPPADTCPPEGSAGALADCDCPDYYHIRIFNGTDEASGVCYEVSGYITGGNLQLHPPVGESI